MKLYLVTIFFLLIILYYCLMNNTENFTNFKADCKPPELLMKVMNNYGINNNNDNWEYYIPCEYDSCEKNIINFEKESKNKKLFLIDGCDWPASKINLWKALKQAYGKDASKVMPTTHLLEVKKDLEDFKIHFAEKNREKEGHMFVLKNYAQRQEGIKLSKDLDEILDGEKNGWYLAQDYLYNPFLVDKRKVNFRYYTLIVCRDVKVNGYIHRDGFVYYTPEFYDENSMDFNKHITTGYIDRKVYEVNPLTLDDFRNHLDKIENGLSKKWDNNVRKMMFKVIKALDPHMCKNNKLSQHVRFQIFGSDVAPTENLDAYLMEINKGPDLNAKDERDKQVKMRMQKDIFKILEGDNIDTLNFESNRFEKIY